MTLNIAIEGTNPAEREYHLELIRNHKRNLKIEAAHAASLEVRHNTGANAEIDIVNAQLENVKFDEPDEDEPIFIKHRGHCQWEAAYENVPETDYRYPLIGTGKTQGEAIEDLQYQLQELEEAQERDTRLEYEAEAADERERRNR